MIVDAFSLITNKMTQAQIDLQNQLEQATADLTTRPLLNDSLVLYIDTSEPTPTNSLEQIEHFVVNQIHFTLHNIHIFLIHTLMVSVCMQDNIILTQ